MKRFPNPDIKRNFLSIKRPEQIQRSSITLGAEENSCCIRCPDTPCVTFSTQIDKKMIPGTVCPTDVLKITSEGEVEVGDGCISCGICAVLCPVGAIEIISGVGARVRATNQEVVEVLRDKASFTSLRDNASTYSHLPSRELHASSKSYSENSTSLTHNIYYRLVSSLFESLKVTTFLPPSGDTNNRIDLILIGSLSSLPVEIKSATETRTINIKSIQQALENRIVLDQRNFFPALPTDSSLVVGHAYPPERSGVNELIDDIRKIYGVNIGLISISELYRKVFEHNLRGKLFKRESLVNLSGELK